MKYMDNTVLRKYKITIFTIPVLMKTLGLSSFLLKLLA